VGGFDSVSNLCIIDNQNNFIILHPDILVSSTLASESFGCIRKSVLDDRIKRFGDSSSSLIYGTILHQLMQISLLSNDWTTESMTKQLDNLIRQNLEELYFVNETETSASTNMQQLIPLFQDWAKNYIKSSNHVSHHNLFVSVLFMN